MQWSSEAPGALSFTPILGATSTTYTTPPTSTSESGTKFEATFKNAKGETSTTEVTLTVNPPPCSAKPAITEQPKDQTVTAPGPATFKASASTPANCEAPSVQWSSEAPGALSFSPILGATSTTYTTPPTSTSESGTKFEATFKNAKGETSTNEVTLTVNPPPCSAKPAITEQPKDQTVTAPAAATFKASASTPANCEAPSVQWSSEAPGALSFSPILGATSTTYTTPPTSTSESGTKFEATFKNAKGETSTNEVTLTVNPPPCSAKPAITEQPKDQTVTAPAAATFKASASTPANCEAPSVQWSSEAPGALSFTPILGATSTTYTTPPTSTSESGTKFEATFKNAKGETSTNEVTLTVNPPPCSAKPAITEQPKDQTVTAPAAATFKASASTPANCEAPSVQWSSEAPGAAELLPDPRRHLDHLHDAAHEHERIGHQVRGDLHERQRRNEHERSDADGQPAALLGQAGDHRTAQRPDGHRPAAATFKASASTPANCEAPSVQWSSEAPGAAELHPDPRRHLDHLHDAAHEHERIGHQVRGHLQERQRRNEHERSDADGQPAALLGQAGDHRTAQRPDGHRPAAASFKASASTPANCEAPSVQWSSEAPGALSFTPILGATSTTYTTPPTSTSESGTKFEATFKNANRRNEHERSDADGQPAALLGQAGDHRTAQRPDGHRPAAASFKASASTPANCEAPSVQWSSEAPGAAELHPDPRRHLDHLHDAAHEHDRIGHQVRGHLHERQPGKRARTK